MDVTYDFKITREWLGGSETIDLSTTEGWEYFAADVTQDYEVAEEVADRIRDHGSATINEDQPEYLERYTKVERDDNDREFSFTLNATFTAANQQDAWDQFVEWLTNPLHVEDGTQVVEFPQAHDPTCLLQTDHPGACFLVPQGDA
jgi:tRNA/tmRNA/rRNA uracil-C5-methylase (TrmA/RlmC/RlmD family)